MSSAFLSRHSRLAAAKTAGGGAPSSRRLRRFNAPSTDLFLLRLSPRIGCGRKSDDSDALARSARPSSVDPSAGGVADCRSESDLPSSTSSSSPLAASLAAASPAAEALLLALSPSPRSESPSFDEAFSRACGAFVKIAKAARRASTREERSWASGSEEAAALSEALAEATSSSTSPPLPLPLLTDLARAHAALGHGGARFGAILLSEAEKAGAAAAAAVGDDEEKAARSLVALLPLVEQRRSGSLEARARLLARLAPAIEASLSRGGEEDGGEEDRGTTASTPSTPLRLDSRSICDVASACAAVLSETGGSGSRRRRKARSAEEEEEEEASDGSLWSAGDAAASEATSRRRAEGEGEGGEVDGDSTSPLLSGAEVEASARSLFSAAASAACLLAEEETNDGDDGEHSPLHPAALARLGRALVESGELSRAVRAARSYAPSKRRGRGGRRAKEERVPPPAERLFDLVARGAASLGSTKGRKERIPAPPPRPQNVLNLSWVMGKAVEASRRARGDGDDGGDPVDGDVDFASAAASALAALSPAIALAAPRADAAGVASAAWALATARSADDDGALSGETTTATAATAAALDALASRCAQLCPTSPPRWTAATLWSLSRARHRHAVAFEAAAAALDGGGRRRLRPLPADVAATLALAFARAGAWSSTNCRAFLDGIASDAQEAADGLSNAAAGCSIPSPSPRPVVGALGPRAAANLAFGLAAAGRLPARLHASLAGVVAGAGDGGGGRAEATAAELGQVHVAAVAVRARSSRIARRDGEESDPSSPCPPLPPPPSLEFESYMRSLFDAGRAERAAAACWGAGAPLGAARVTRSQREMCEAASSLLSDPSLLAAEHRAAGLAAVDAAVPSRKVAIEFDGPSHYFANSPSRAVGGTRFKRRLLRSQGWRVVSVPHFHWSQLGTEEQRRGYVAVALLRRRASEALKGVLSETAVAEARAALGGPEGDERLSGALWDTFEAMREEYERIQDYDDVGDEEEEEEGEDETTAERRRQPPPPPPPPSPRPPPPPPASAADMTKRIAALRVRQGKLPGAKGGIAGAALEIRRTASVAAATAAAAAAKREKEAEGEKQNDE